MYNMCQYFEAIQQESWGHSESHARWPPWLEINFACIAFSYIFRLSKIMRHILHMNLWLIILR